MISKLAVSGIHVEVIPGPPARRSEGFFSVPDHCFLKQPSLAFPCPRITSHFIIYSLAIYSAACCCGDTMVNKSDKVNRALMALLTIQQLNTAFILEFMGWTGVTLRIITALIWLQQTPQASWLLPRKKKKEWTIESDKDYGAREDQFKLSMGSSENLVAKGDQFCDAQVGGGTAGARSLRLG